MKSHTLLSAIFGAKTPTEGLEAIRAEFASENDSLKASLAEANARAEKAEKELAELHAKVQADKLQARKDTLVAKLGTEPGEAAFKSSKSMTDEDFESFCSVLFTSREQEAKSPAFQEQGTPTTAKPEHLEQSAQSAIADIFKAKYGEPK